MSVRISPEEALVLDVELKPKGAKRRRWKPKSKAARLRAGELCPLCKEERLDYDGLLNLSCPRCGVAVAGCFI